MQFSQFLITSSTTAFVATIFAAAFLSSQAFGHQTGKGVALDHFDDGEAVYMNFIKVLAGVLITTPQPPSPILDSVKTIMRDTMNTQGENEKFLNFLMTGMTQVKSFPLSVQVDNMLRFMTNLTEEPQLSAATQTLQNYLNSLDGAKVYTDIEMYVVSLFQPIITTPMIDSQGETFNSLAKGRPANRAPNNYNQRSKLFR